MNRVTYIVQIVEWDEMLFVAAVQGPKGLMIERAFHQCCPNNKHPTKEEVQKFLLAFCKGNDCTIIPTEEVTL